MLNPIVVIMNEPKHLLNATEVTTSRNGVETKHAKMLMALCHIVVKSFNRILYFS